MDLSAVIFVVLALAWAGYLIPKALKHHDEMASDRLVEGHSERVRILSRKGSAGKSPTVEVEIEHIDTAETHAAVPTPAGPRPQVTRAAARKAAQRRRRVLGGLLLVVAVVAGLAGFALVPWWSTAIPAGLAVLFLVVARRTVRNFARARRAVSALVVETSSMAEPAPVRPRALDETERLVERLVERLTEEDTVGVQRQELEAALTDDGSLWDPLPMTLPTYVNKARARRTVRTIELTGINSSGHDEADSTLARENESATPELETDTEQRRVAGA